MGKPEVGCPSRLNKVGGQAVMEGVMMKAGDRVCTTVRREDGSLVVKSSEFKSVRKKHKILNIPILRGIINFVEMMILSYKTLSLSADVFLGEEAAETAEPESKFEAWLDKHVGPKLTGIVMVISSVLGVVLALGLFLYLPSFARKGIELLTGDLPNYADSIIDGVIKIGIFVLYIWSVSFIPYIRRTFEFHGAEHKSIACYESGDELTPANAKKHTRFHPRCGTSFIFVMLLLSILVYAIIYSLVPNASADPAIFIPLKLLVLPLIVGLGFEFIMYAGKHTNALTRLLSAPGLWMQRLTTREPDEEQLAVAILSLKSALVEEFGEQPTDVPAPAKKDADDAPGNDKE